MVDGKKICRAIGKRLDSMTNDEKIAYLERMGFVLVDKPDKKVKPKGRAVRVRRRSVQKKNS